ncbi:MAG: GIY-YIG nuclease family protein [Christiangramia sp.]|nr:GIY-YIG nuclease family protein [Christiangramia sp.]
MFQYFVYILKCSDGSYYTGITNDFERRIIEHQDGIDPTCYTFKRRPLKLEFNEEFDNVLIAINFEKKIKDWTRLKKRSFN